VVCEEQARATRASGNRRTNQRRSMSGAPSGPGGRRQYLGLSALVKALVADRRALRATDHGSGLLLRDPVREEQPDQRDERERGERRPEPVQTSLLVLVQDGLRDVGARAGLRERR